MSLFLALSLCGYTRTLLTLSPLSPLLTHARTMRSVVASLATGARDELRDVEVGDGESKDGKPERHSLLTRKKKHTHTRTHASHNVTRHTQPLSLSLSLSLEDRARKGAHGYTRQLRDVQKVGEDL